MNQTFNIDVFNVATGEFDLGTVTLGPKYHQIGYRRDRRSGAYIVTWRTENGTQEIIVQPAFFHRITGIDRSEFAGLVIVTETTLDTLGFIRKEVPLYARLKQSAIV